MTEVMIGALGIIGLAGGILLGINVIVTLGIVGAGGLLFLAGFEPATSILSTVFFSVVHSFHFSVIPMFLLMGYFASNAGIGRDLFEAASMWFGRVRGGLAIATTGAAAAFGAASGSSVGTASLFTRMALPEMLALGYDKRLASACIAISGTLAVMIPPSGLMVVYGILTDTSIGKLLLAGLLPGLVFTLVICLTSYTVVRLRPELAPKREETFSLREKVWSLRLIGPLMLVITLIMGGLYAGVFTPTEAGAIGAFATFIIAVVRHRGVRGVNLLSVLRETGETTAMIFAIIITALIFSRYLAYSGVTDAISDLLTGAQINRWWILVFISLIYMVLGMLMDAPALLAITLPITHPVIMELGFDPVWFGVYVVVLAELGAVTPPVGIVCFVVKGAAGNLVTLEDIFRGILPFVFACCVMLVIMCLFPQLALWLPAAVR